MTGPRYASAWPIRCKADRLESSLVEKVDREVSQQRAEAIESGHRARRQLILIVPFTALLTLLAAVSLGWYATRSITDPLSELRS